MRLHSGGAVLTLAAMALALWAGLINAAPAANLAGVEQAAQRIFYSHMGTNMMALTGFFVSFACSIFYLVRRRSRWDRLATAGVEVGLIGGLGTLVSGSIWAKPAWGVYWDWDPRLTTAAILVLIYIAYLQVRNGMRNPRARAMVASIYAILAYATVPLTYYSAVWFRSIHPMMLLDSNPDSQGDFALGPTMGLALRTFMVAYVLLAVVLLALRTRMLGLDDRLRMLQAKLD